MQKIIVIGCPGSGKSTFSRALHDITGIELFHLDMLYWTADRMTVERGIFLERLSQVLQKNAWIIDGNYASTMEQRMRACDTVIFLDYPPEVCLAGIRERRGKPRSDIPWIETEEDADFVEFIKNYNRENRPQVLRLLSQYQDKTIYVFTNRSQADAFLAQIKP